VERFHILEEEQSGVDRISFRLMNRLYDLTLDEWYHHFGFENNTTTNHTIFFTLNPAPLN
jgi:hypothetical protein